MREDIFEQDINTMKNVDFDLTTNEALKTYLKNIGPFFTKYKSLMKKASAQLKEYKKTAVRCLLQVSFAWAKLFVDMRKKVNP